MRQQALGEHFESDEGGKQGKADRDMALGFISAGMWLCAYLPSCLCHSLF